MQNINSYFKMKESSERGAVSVILALLLLLVLIPIAALAVDLAFLYLARNQLQNAADSGAMAGARQLYTPINIADGTYVINPVTIRSTAETAAMANMSMGSSVEVQTPEIGHWSFMNQSFNESQATKDTQNTVQVDIKDLWVALANKSEQEILEIIDNHATGIVNAVRVVTERNATPVTAFFSRLWGHESFSLSAEAVAYVGFRGQVSGGDEDFIDLPIAICRESIIDEDYNFVHNIARMLDSGQDPSKSNTAGWTNFSQPPSTADTTSIRNVLDGCNPYEEPISFQELIGTTGGVVDSIFDHPNQASIMDCWLNAGLNEHPSGHPHAGFPKEPWNVRLLLIECPGNNVANASVVTGVVYVDFLWMIEKGQTSGGNAYDEAPYEMWDGEGGWSSTLETSGEDRWDSFVDYYGLKNADNEDAPYAKKSILFRVTGMAEPGPSQGVGNPGPTPGLTRLPILVN